MTAKVFSDAVTRHATNPRTDRLDHGHQRKAEQHGPSKPVAELGAHLAVGRDAARIVVRRPGHQARSQALEEAEQPRRGRLKMVSHCDVSESCWPVTPTM